MPADSSNGISGLSAAKQALLRARMQKVASVPDHVIPRRSQTQAPLSFAQQRLWFLDQFDPHSCAYNVARVFRLLGPVRHESLQKALNAIVARHEVLRTTFRAVNGEPMQIVASARPVPLQVVDLSQLADSNRDAKVHELIAAAGTRPFDLGSDLMLRATLLALQPDQHILVVM